MAGFSDYLEVEIADWLNGTQMPTPPTDLYVGLFNGDPTDSGSGGTEVTTTIRAAGRVTCTYSRSGGVLTNTSAADFGTADAGATVDYFAIFDAASSGNMLMHAAVSSGGGAITTGQAVSFAIGALTLTVD